VAVVASLLAFFKDDTKFNRPQSRVQEVILMLTYAAIILSISATISTLALTDEFSEIPSRASRELGLKTEGTVQGSVDSHTSK